ncbi:MAG: DUF3332 family protein [Planctomycetes bacterium]|nr:DUF3332 family protein [Planctomycetota bacterium]
MKKLMVVGIALLILVGSTACYGPMKVTRQLDDWLNQQYVDSPWLVGNVVSVMFIGIAYYVTGLVDYVVLNPIDFWGTSAQPFGTGVGTPFEHKNPNAPAKK